MRWIHILNSDQFSFDEWILEEASQIPLSAFLPLLYHYSKVKRICIIGDPRQLPPYGTNGGFDIMSLFDVYLLTGETPKMLVRQYRIPKPIADKISIHEYGGKLITIDSKDVPVEQCLLWIDVKGKEQVHDTSKRNEGEVGTLKAMLPGLVTEHPLGAADGLTKSNILSLTGYRAQLSALQKAVEAVDQAEAATIDSFQGREMPVVVFSLVGTQSVGFLEDRRRANVAVSRVTEKLYMLGDIDFWITKTETCPLVAALAKVAKEHNVVMSG